MQSYIRRISVVTVAVLLAACDSQTVASTSPRAPTLPRSASNAVERIVEEYIFV